MRRSMWITCLLAAAAPVALAQHKIESQWRCGKVEDQRAYDVGDRDHHAYSVGKASCTAVKSDMGGEKEKDGSAVQFDEINDNRSQWHGEFISKTQGGDEVYYSYRGKGTLKDNLVENGAHSWTIHGGTGKFKDAKGSGTCNGKLDGDATLWTCRGTYTTGPGKKMVRKPAEPQH